MTAQHTSVTLSNRRVKPAHFPARREHLAYQRYCRWMLSIGAKPASFEKWRQVIDKKVPLVFEGHHYGRMLGFYS